MDINLVPCAKVGGNTNPHLDTMYRYWCFTAFNEPKWADKLIRYMVYQKEICPETKTEHFQGYLELKRTERLSWLKKLDPKAHWEPRKGTREEARAYCMKEASRGADPIEFGEWISGKGFRSDLSETCKTLKEKGLKGVIEETPEMYVKFSRGLEKLELAYNTNNERRLNLKVYVLWGEAGSGKTRYVYDNEPELYKLDCGNNLWWDGYNGEKVLLIDDFYGWIKYGTLLNILDVYPYRCEIKGGFKMAKWEKVYITSNKPPDDWYDKGLTPALKRRLSEIRELVKPA